MKFVNEWNETNKTKHPSFSDILEHNKNNSENTKKINEIKNKIIKNLKKKSAIEFGLWVACCSVSISLVSKILVHIKSKNKSKQNKIDAKA
ncbi:hypothetical protein IJG72_05315 [bacterium]|nr:hypothetical protein [bacterium]